MNEDGLGEVLQHPHQGQQQEGSGAGQGRHVWPLLPMMPHAFLGNQPLMRWAVPADEYTSERAQG